MSRVGSNLDLLMLPLRAQSRTGKSMQVWKTNKHINADASGIPHRKENSCQMAHFVRHLTLVFGHFGHFDHFDHFANYLIAWNSGRRMDWYAEVCTSNLIPGCFQHV